MEKEEILEVIQNHLNDMNCPSGKAVSQRFEDLRVVVNLLAQLVLKQENHNSK